MIVVPEVHCLGFVGHVTKEHGQCFIACAQTRKRKGTGTTGECTHDIHAGVEQCPIYSVRVINASKARHDRVLSRFTILEVGGGHNHKVGR